MSFMSFLNLFIFLFVSITFKFLPIDAQNTCKSSNCSIYGPQIKFPFLLKGQQDEICGYPGFNLTCSSQGQVAIDLPFWGRFFVREIDYNTRLIKLYDPNNCLPRRILELNLSGSPFVGFGYISSYSFFNCLVKDPTSYRIFNITCLSNSTNTVIAINAHVDYIFQDCVKIVTVYNVPYLGSDMNDMWLTWNHPQCEFCESYGGVCGVRSVGSEDVACFYPKQGKDTMRIISIIIIIPTIVFLSCVVFLKYKMNKRDMQNTNNSIPINLRALAPSPQSITGSGGLDDSTIQSYPRVILGEISHIPGLNHNNCPICLSEFLAKETVRFIPECTHCFHSNCIDEWLRLNSSCPVCRSSPTSHVDSSLD